MRRVRNNDGFALVTSIVMLTVMLGLGLGLLLLTDGQQKASAREQASESSFNVAEAALNAQVGQLSRSWPGESEQAYPASCTAATSTTTNGCPDKGSLSVGYPNISPVACPAGSATEAWGSPLTNQWTTYVRDDGASGASATQLYTSSIEQSAPRWDKNGDGKVWARSVGVIQCRIVTLIALVSEQIVTIPFPQSAVAGNWFETSNTGNKVIVNTLGTASQAGGVSMRCTGRTEAECRIYDKTKGQVNPDTTSVGPSPNPTWSASQLETIKAQAKAAGTYFAAGKCPANLAELSGKPTYVEGPCELAYISGIGNSKNAPGFLVIVNGTLNLNGNAEFFGTVYAVNAQNSSGVVVEVHGNSTITGSIAVDGNGGISFGSSKENFVYDNTAVLELKAFAGASATRNSFRVLPVNQ
jgi:parallel beta-helix repeat protein